MSRPWGYLGLIFTHGVTTSLLFLIAAGGSIAGWAVLAAVWGARLSMGWVVGVRCLKDPMASTMLWAAPIRDLISFGLWCYSFIGDRIEWRGRSYKLLKGGKLMLLNGPKK